MAITLIDTKQIRNYTSPTGVFTPTGLIYSGNIGVSGLLTSVSGNFQSGVFNELTVLGALNSPFLSGILGQTTAGSGILHFVAIPDVSGGNEHYRAVFSTGNPNNPIQSFSSQDSQAEWQYFFNSSWSSFPSLGLNNSQQQSSIVRLMFKPTGFNINDIYYVHSQTVYAGNVTGGYQSSLQFKANTNGFTLSEIPSVASLFETSDSRYARKLQIGSNFVLSGVKVSGLPFTLQTFASLPVTGHGTGTMIQVSGQVYNWHERVGFSGFQRVSNYTGISVGSGGVLSGPQVIFSGLGGTDVRQSGNFILISGAAGGGGGAGTVTGIQAASGSQVITGGSLPNVIIISGTRNIPTRRTVDGGGNPYLEVSDGTYIHKGNGGTELYYGTVMFSGTRGITFDTIQNRDFTYDDTVTFNTDAGFGTLIGLTALGIVTGFGVNNASLFSGTFKVSGASGVSVGLANFGGNTSGILLSGTTLGITGQTNLQGIISLIPSGSIQLAYSGNNIVIGEADLVYSGTNQKNRSINWHASGTTNSSGQVLFYPTNNGAIGGTALFTNIYSVQATPRADTNTAIAVTWASVKQINFGNKEIVINVLSGVNVPGVTPADSVALVGAGTQVFCSIFGE